MFRILLALLIVLVGGLAHVDPARADPDLLEPEKAFRIAAKAIDANTVEVSFRIANGYYMYREKFAFAVEPATVTLGAPGFPRGEEKHDEFFGRMETYRKNVAIKVPVAGEADKLKLAVTSQGCADIGVCYPPMTQHVEVKLAGLSGGQSTGSSFGQSSASTPGSSPASSSAATLFEGRAVTGQPPIISDEGRFEQVLASGNFLLIVGLFFGAGLLLTFTPCVLPMIPILSGIIVGEGREATRARALTLSLAYVLGMAVTYTAIGVLAALSGSFLSAALQNPWVLAAFALVFVALALSMFGFYDLQLPSALQSRVTEASGKLKGGHIGAVVLMGVLSAAIVSPCVAAPLAGALLYISQTRDALLGASALFAMALGMGVPLIAVGVTEGALLPKSGHWMKAVKKFFGFMLLGVAIWIVSPLLAVWVQMVAWAALLIIGAMFLHALDPLPHDASGFARFWKGVGVIALLAGASLVLGALSGSRDLLQPLSNLRTASSDSPASSAVRFERVKTLAELDARLKTVNQPVMLDFYADWCVSCKEMERFTFSHAQVRDRLGEMLLLQVDVTDNTADDQQLLKRFRLFGPPGIIFFDKSGREIPGLRVIGYQSADRFLQTLAQAQAQAF